MKKIMSVFLAVVTLFVLTVPNLALADSVSKTVTDLVVNASQSGENKISFTVQVPYGAVSYKVYRHAGSASFNPLTGSGRPIASSTVSKKTTVTVIVPTVGNYYIVSSAQSGRYYYTDCDGVGVNYRDTKFSTKIKWTKTEILKNKVVNATGNQFVDATINVLAVGGAAVCALVPGCSVVVTAFVIKVGGAVVADVAFTPSASLKNIRTVPIENYSWQYKYVPTKTGYATYLLVYDPNNSLVSTFNLGSITIK